MTTGRAHLTVFEGDEIDLPAGRLRGELVDRLLRVYAGHRAAFVARRRRVYATGFVGAVDVGPLRIEILPKAYGVETAAEGRDLMFHLLRWAGRDARVTWLKGSSNTRRGDLLEIVERRVSEELLTKLEAGRPRAYTSVEETSTQLRGRVVFSEYARQLPSMQHRVPIRYSYLTANNTLTQMLKALAMYLHGRARSLSTRRRLGACIEMLGQAETRTLTNALVSKVKLGRYDSDWTELVHLAGVIARKNSPNPTIAGDSGQATLLFPVAHLFEQAVRRSLVTHLARPFECLRSSGAHTLLTHALEKPAYAALDVRPDLLFVCGSRFAAAGDAKWKRLALSSPRYGISPADLYQLLAYMKRFGTKTGLLFFPRVAGLPLLWQTHFQVHPDNGERVGLFAVDLRELVTADDSARSLYGDALAQQVKGFLAAEPSAPA